MNKYFYTVTIGPGMDQTGLIKTKLSTDEIYKYLRTLSIENAESFGYYQDEDYFDGYMDSVGRNWDDEEECYEDERNLEYWFELYDPEEHDYRVIEVEFEEI